MTYGEIQLNAKDIDKKYYVYMWYEKINGDIAPVYIGKGSGSRWKNKSARSNIAKDYFKAHDCKSMILAQELTETVAYIVEEKVKTEMRKRGIKLLDAEQNQNEHRRRQAEGIAAMQVVDGKRVSRKTGNAYGRPKQQISDFEKISKKQKDGQITVSDACKELGISRTQWYRLVKECA